MVRHGESVLWRIGLAHSQFVGVWELAQDSVVARRAEEFDNATKNRIHYRAGMHHIEIERHQDTTEMKFRIIVERAAAIRPQLLRNAPANHVPQGVEVQMQIERDCVAPLWGESPGWAKQLMS